MNDAFGTAHHELCCLGQSVNLFEPENATSEGYSIPSPREVVFTRECREWNEAPRESFFLKNCKIR
jgi:hypothetical protein